jgi:diguanylate cyclase (GGDEF)-like protein
MYSLYESLLAQHPRQLVPVRCAGSTIAQLQRYFEDVVLENRLSALVAESVPTATELPARDVARLQELGKTTSNLFLWATSEDPLSPAVLTREKGASGALVFEPTAESHNSERFVVIADARFSALLASVHDAEDHDSSRDLVVWTFEPDVVYSALEYLMARVTAEHPDRSEEFAQAVRTCMPQATSLQLTLGVTTKLARLLQEQAEREIAVNRLATAIRKALDLESVLQTAADEVGRALSAHSCAVRVDGALVGRQLAKCYLRPDVASQGCESLLGEIDSVTTRLTNSPEGYVVDGDGSQSPPLLPHAVVPLIHGGKSIGVLWVRSDDLTRVWADNELLLLHTVADQLVGAAYQAHLFSQMEQQALTDGLTDCYNRRAFELQLERDLHLAMRMHQPLSLIMLDFDNFKTVNDKAGHGTGDTALRMLADHLRAELRAVDTAARFGGDEFVIILPQSGTDGALLVAERLRKRIEQMDVPGVGSVTVSFGIATFPDHAASRDTLVVAADRALYYSKEAGRNRVSTVEALPSNREFPSISSRRRSKFAFLRLQKVLDKIQKVLLLN